MSYTFSRLFYNALYNVLLQKSIANIAFLNAKIWVVYVMVEKKSSQISHMRHTRIICITIVIYQLFVLYLSVVMYRIACVFSTVQVF